jgi:hypothetical protein
MGIDELSFEPDETEPWEKAPWFWAWDMLHKICTCATIREVDELMPKYRSAHQIFRMALEDNWQDPAQSTDADGKQHWLRDRRLESALNQLLTDLKTHNILFADRQNRPDLVCVAEEINRFRNDTLRARAQDRSTSQRASRPPMRPAL